jgi:hypothetical protein
MQILATDEVDGVLASSDAFRPDMHKKYPVKPLADPPNLQSAKPRRAFARHPLGEPYFGGCSWTLRASR